MSNFKKSQRSSLLEKLQAASTSKSSGPRPRNTNIQHHFQILFKHRYELKDSKFDIQAWFQKLECCVKVKKKWMQSFLHPFVAPVTTCLIHVVGIKFRISKKFTKLNEFNINTFNTVFLYCFQLSIFKKRTSRLSDSF